MSTALKELFGIDISKYSNVVQEAFKKATMGQPPENLAMQKLMGHVQGYNPLDIQQSEHILLSMENFVRSDEYYNALAESNVEAHI